MLNCFAIFFMKRKGAEKKLLNGCCATSKNVSFIPHNVIFKWHPDFGYGLISYQVSASDFDIELVSEENGDLVCLGGYSYSKDENLKKSGGVLQLVKDKGSEAVYESLYGSYSVVNVSSDGFIKAIADPSGFEALFYYEDSDVVVVGNRASVVNALVASKNLSYPSLEVLSEILVEANLIGENTPFYNVKHLTPGFKLFFERSMVLAEITPLSERQGSESECGDHYDNAAQALKNEWKSLAATYPGKIKVGLTGGKDSRLNLSGAIAAGLHDRIECFTNGHSDHPEVICAQNICREIGVSHVSNYSNKPQPDFDPQLIWSRLKHHSFLMDGMVSAWDGLTSPINSSSMKLEISGFAGGIYKPYGRNYLKTNFNEFSDVQSFFKNWQQPQDPLGCTNDGLIQGVKNKLHHLVNKKLSEGVQPHNLSTVLLLEGRTPLWSGVLSQNLVDRVRVIPLLNSEVRKAGFSQSSDDRKKQKLHYEIIKRCDDDLARLPFFKDQWSKELQEDISFNKSHFSTPFVGAAGSNSSQAMVPAKWKFLEHERNNILGFLLDYSRSPLMDMINPAKLYESFNKELHLKTVPGAKYIYSLIGMQNFFVGSVDPTKHTLKKVRSGCQDIEIDSNVPGAAVNFNSSLTDFSLVFAGCESFYNKVPQHIDIEKILKEIKDSNDCYPTEQSLQPDKENSAFVNNASIPVNLSFEIPKGELKRLRLDPVSNVAKFIIGEVVLSFEGFECSLSIDMIKNAVFLDFASNGSLYESLNNDPQFFLNLPDSAVGRIKSSSATSFNLRVSILSDVATKVAVYYDLGFGFGEKSKCVSKLPASHLS